MDFIEWKGILQILLCWQEVTVAAGDTVTATAAEEPGTRMTVSLCLFIPDYHDYARLFSYVI